MAIEYTLVLGGAEVSNITGNGSITIPETTVINSIVYDIISIKIVNPKQFFIQQLFCNSKMNISGDGFKGCITLQEIIILIRHNPLLYIMQCVSVRNDATLLLCS